MLVSKIQSINSYGIKNLKQTEINPNNSLKNNSQVQFGMKCPKSVKGLMTTLMLFISSCNGYDVSYFKVRLVKPASEYLLKNGNDSANAIIQDTLKKLEEMKYKQGKKFDFDLFGVSGALRKKGGQANIEAADALDSVSKHSKGDGSSVVVNGSGLGIL